MFTDTGFWDTFRCLFPFLNLMYPEMNQKMQEGLVNAYKESGFLPEWASPGHRDCMVGNNSASVVADAYIKGLRGYDIETLWEALKHDANSQLPRTASGRVAYEEYNKLGYVPNNIGIGQTWLVPWNMLIMTGRFIPWAKNLASRQARSISSSNGLTTIRMCTTQNIS